MLLNNNKCEIKHTLFTVNTHKEERKKMFVKVSTDGGVGWHRFIQDGCLTSGVVRYSKGNMGYVPEEDNSNQSLRQSFFIIQNEYKLCINNT